MGTKGQKRVLVGDEVFAKLKFKSVEQSIPMREIVEKALEEYLLKLK